MYLFSLYFYAMKLEKSFRWFGPDDDINLEEIKQLGATGIVTALHHIPNGAIWSEAEIKMRLDQIQQKGLIWRVVESLPVHNSIKEGQAQRDKLIENYKISMANLAKHGIDTICYNFMPVLDWVRTNLSYKLPDGGITMHYDHITFAAFDIYILKRPNATNDYSEEVIHLAEQHFSAMTDEDAEELAHTIIIITQGFIDGLMDANQDDYKRSFLNYIKEYENIGTNELRENLAYFLEKIIPTAEKYGIKMAIHADDPAFPVLGLPRIVSTESDLEWILNTNKSVNNGLTFCTGSFSSCKENNITQMAEKFADRIHFLHLRNTKYISKYEFIESGHLEGDVDMYSVMKTMISQNRTIPMRPDHGIKILSDLDRNTNPGYPLLGRMKGLAELVGLPAGCKAARPCGPT